MNGFEKTRELVEAIARTGRAERGVSRLALTESDREARAIAVSEMESLGMTVRTDACCNIWAEYPGTSDQPGVVIGSHLDSVPEGGDYDGAYDAAVSVDTGELSDSKKTVYSAICTALYEHFDAAGDTGRTEELSERIRQCDVSNAE